MFTVKGHYPPLWSHNTHQGDKKRALMKRLHHGKPKKEAHIGIGANKIFERFYSHIQLLQHK